MSSDSMMRAAIVACLGKWPLTNAATPTALEYLHQKGDLTRVIDAAVKQIHQSSSQGLDPKGIDSILLRLFSAENMRMLASASDSPAFKLAHERELSEAVSDKVIQRAIRVAVDNGPQGTWPGEILVKASQRLCKEVGSEELTPYRIDRMLEDIVIEDAWGSFYFGSDGKRRLRLNSQEWREARMKKASPPPPTGLTLGDQTGVYGADSR
jgi:hypothetical protein